MELPAELRKVLRSQKLALVLLILLAAVAVVGTPWSADEAAQLFTERFGSGSLPAARFFGLVDTYRSPVFIVLLLLFTANIALCTWHRFSLFLKSGRGPGRAVRSSLDLLMHFSIIVILLGGAAKGLFASVGTQYLFTGVESATFYDAGTKSDVPLGFTLLMKERVEDYYPLAVRVGVTDAPTGEKLALLEIREGRSAVLPGGDLRLSVGVYDIEGKWIEIAAEGSGRRETSRLEIVPGGRTSALFQEFELVLVGWRRDVRRVRGLVAVLDGGEQVKKQWLYPNARIGYRGTSIFMTAWGEDQYRNPYIGIQVSRDPGAVLFWIGATLLAVTLPLFLIVRHRGRG
jgi:hypothetical protein